MNAIFNQNFLDLTLLDDKGYSSMNYAITKSSITCLEYLLKMDIDINVSHPEADDSNIYDLVETARHTDIEFIKKLIEYGINVNTKNRGTETTPLHAARICEIAQCLIDAGANIDAQDYIGHTPLMNALLDLMDYRRLIKYEQQNTEKLNIINLLLMNGADINHQNKNGNSILHLAVINKDIETVKFLLSKNIDCNIINKYGETALFDAYRMNDIKMQELLIRHMNPELVFITNKKGIMASQVETINSTQPRYMLF